MSEQPLHLPSGQVLGSYRALVRTDTDRVLSVVSGGYRANGRDNTELQRIAGRYELVTNEEAIRVGKEIFAMVFGEVSADGLYPSDLTMPKSEGFMLADLASDADALQLVLQNGDEDDWSPFLRVSNSYNRTHKIAFTIGVRRKICANGMIGEDGVTYSDPHRHPLDAWLDDIKKKPHTAYGLRRFDPESVQKRLAHLQEVKVPEQDFLAGVVMTLGLKPPAMSDNGQERPPKPGSIVHWGKVGDHLARLESQYVKDHGPNAYALLNAASEYASRARAPGMNARRVDPLQRRCGEMAKKLKSPKAKFEVTSQAHTAVGRIEQARELARRIEQARKAAGRN